MMKQLLFNFGKTIRRHLRLLPDAELPRPPRNPALRRDPLLEALCRRMLRAAGCRGLKVSVYWNSRLRTTAGLACPTRKAIQLNPKLVDVCPGEVQRTLRHELAHFLAEHRAGRRHIAPHGPEWRRACRDLGIPNEPRCHDIPLPRTRMERKYFYMCRSCGTRLARVRPMRHRVACLRCCRKANGGKYDDRFRFVQDPEKMAA